MISSGAGLALIFLVGFWGAARFQGDVSPPPAFSDTGEMRELVLVLVVDTGCPGSASPELPGLWNALVDRAHVQLPSSMDRVTTLAAVSAPNPGTGFEFLERFGHFEEVVSGRRRSSAALRYVYQDLRGPAAVPQVVVVHREFRRSSNGQMERGEERVIRRYVGPSAIERAAERMVLSDPSAG